MEITWGICFFLPHLFLFFFFFLTSTFLPTIFSFKVPPAPHVLLFFFGFCFSANATRTSNETKAEGEVGEKSLHINYLLITQVMIFIVLLLQEGLFAPADGNCSRVLPSPRLINSSSDHLWDLLPKDSIVSRWWDEQFGTDSSALNLTVY